MNTMISSNDRNEGPPGTTGISAASQRNGEARPSCIICQAKIVNNQWFCRLPRNGNGEAHAESLAILLCSPRCALRHFAALRPCDNGFDSDYDQHEHTFHFLVDGEKPTWL
jgi:hypothetical protein